MRSIAIVVIMVCGLAARSAHAGRADRDVNFFGGLRIGGNWIVADASDADPGAGPGVGAVFGLRAWVFRVEFSWMSYFQHRAVSPDEDSKHLGIFGADLSIQPGRGRTSLIYVLGMDAMVVPGAGGGAGVGFHAGIGLERWLGDRLSLNPRVLYRFARFPEPGATESSDKYNVHMLSLEIDLEAHGNFRPGGGCPWGAYCTTTYY
jgi:hypothetical protein